ncbi:hypothetical protein AVEN_146367-1 [Araneus ventricosus]|uniref:Uncharacterized protein n=2 Tax=Araneus ventricosus TaxID=182803 RepID=A0A4Y2W9I5_ARAVE|nr:hypothetical protein AVEN_146367-1 [Araneus ventricosus]
MRAGTVRIVRELSSSPHTSGRAILAEKSSAASVKSITLNERVWKFQTVIRNFRTAIAFCLKGLWIEKFKPFLLSINTFTRWLKAHVGYSGNECADQLAKEAITKGDPFLLPKPLSYLKSEIKSAALSIWQDNWDNGETGSSTHDIEPRVSNKPVGWNREEIMFVTGHGPFPSYLHRFNLRTHDSCSSGEEGDPMHYATKCRFTLSWHFQTPTVSLKLQWLKNILTNNLSRTRLRLLMFFICDEKNLIVEDNN